MNVVEDDIVSLTLLGLPKSWQSYQYSINEREKILNWERLWSDLVHEEFRRNKKDRTSSKVDDEENVSLARKGNKGKWNNTQRNPKSSQNNGKNKYLRKIKYAMNSDTMQQNFCTRSLLRILQEEQQVKHWLYNSN